MTSATSPSKPRPPTCSATPPRSSGHAGDRNQQIKGKNRDLELKPVPVPRSAGDPGTLANTNSIAPAICTVQGNSGQRWWHYDSRTDRVVEGYPVYSVHQDAMALMDLFDPAEAGSAHIDAICKGVLDRDTAP
jgi:hypothetical protein